MPSSMSGLAIGAALRKKAKKHMKLTPMAGGGVKSARDIMNEGIGKGMMTDWEYKRLNPPKRYTVKQMLERAKKNAGM